MKDPRQLHTATLLSNGMVLVAGGLEKPGTLSVAELYDPAAMTFAAVSSPLHQARHNHTASLLTNGTVLITDPVQRRGL
jgi:hypothetical protein